MFSKKLSVLFFAITLFVFVFPDKIQIAFDNSSDYNSLISDFSGDYYYNFKQGEPVVPSQKFRLEIEGRAVINEAVFKETSRTTLKDGRITVGEDPLPLFEKPNERSLMFSQKTRIPEADFQIRTGYENNKTIIYGFVSDYVFENNVIIKRSGTLIIDYTVSEKQAVSSSLKSILIIAPDSLKASWDGYKSCYPDFDVSIVSVDDIISATSPTDTFVKNIREYIQNEYQTKGLKGIILAGDVDYIPGIKILLYITPSLDSSDQILITDKYYSCLDGDWNFDSDSLFGEIEDSIDIFPDVFVGRVPAKNSGEVANFISKVISFRSLTNDTFLGVASYLDAYTDGGLHIDNMIKLVPITAPVKKLYASLSNLSSTTFKSAMNKSPMFVSHDGHGNYNAIQTGANYIYTTDMDYLSNAKPIFMYSLSCLSAAYDEDCIAEHFLKSPGGGYYLGNSRYGWYTPYFPGFGTGDLYNLYFYSNIFNETRNPVDALYRTFQKFSYEISEVNDWRWQFFTLNFFGDPMVVLNTGKPISSIDIQHPVFKNGILSLNIEVKDSAYIEISSDTLIFGKTLHPYDNLLSARIDDSDSIFLHVSTDEISDFDTVIYPQNNKAFAVYAEKYSFSNKSGDTLSLSLNLSTDSAGDYLVKPVWIADTFPFIVTDSVFTIADSILLEFDFVPAVFPENISSAKVVLGFDTIHLQYGRNLSENVTFSAKPSKQHYTDSESGDFNVSIKNKFGIEDVIIEFEGESVLLDTFPSLNNAEYLQNFTLNSSSSQVPMNFTIKYGPQEILKTYNLSANGDISYFEFEDTREMAVDSSDASFHKSTNRASSGIYSYFCGDDASPTYPADYVTGIYSDSFVFDTSAFIGFDAFVDIESGMDYIVVYIYSDTIYAPLITLSGRNDSFRTYVFNASDYPVFSGLNARLAFEFFSENDVYQYEGVYIDNVLLPGNLVSMGTENEVFTLHEKRAYENPILNVRNDILYAGGFVKNELYSVYDLSGRKIMSGKLDKKMNAIKLSVPNGKYFFSAGSNNEFVKSFLILK